MIVQTITLGGVTLPSESRSMPGFGNIISSQRGRSADGTLHADYVARKLSFAITYQTVSSATKILLDNILETQVSTAVFPEFTYTDENGVAQSFNVELGPLNYGPLIPQSDNFYYQGVTLNLEQV